MWVLLFLKSCNDSCYFIQAWKFVYEISFLNISMKKFQLNMWLHWNLPSLSRLKLIWCGLDLKFSLAFLGVAVEQDMTLLATLKSIAFDCPLSEQIIGKTDKHLGRVWVFDNLMFIEYINIRRTFYLIFCIRTWNSSRTENSWIYHMIPYFNAAQYHHIVHIMLILCTHFDTYNHFSADPNGLISFRFILAALGREKNIVCTI